MDIFKFFINELKEETIVNNILMYSHTNIDPLLKKDLTTFSFIWKGIQERFVKFNLSLHNNLHYNENDVNDVEKYIYIEILNKIENMIIEDKIPKNKMGFSYKKKKKSLYQKIIKKNTAKINTFYILNKWNYQKGFLPNLHQFSNLEVINLTKKFVLLFNPVNRLRLLKKLNMI